MESHYPVSVKPLENYKLSLTFDNAEKRIFDVKPYLEDTYYAPLKNPTVFRAVKIKVGEFYYEKLIVKHVFMSYY
jgi:hypothetical protein